MLKMMVEFVMMKILLNNKEAYEELEIMKRQLRRGFLSPYEMYTQLYEFLDDLAIKHNIVSMPELQNMTDSRSSYFKSTYTEFYICDNFERCLNQIAFEMAWKVGTEPACGPTEVEE